MDTEDKQMKRCQTKFVPIYEKSLNNFGKKFTKKLINHVRVALMKQYKKTVDQKEKKLIMKKYKEILKQSKKSFNNKMRQNLNKSCKISFCNPACKGTIFQDNTFPEKEIIESIKNTNNIMGIKKFTKKQIRQTVNLIKNTRKSIFKGRKSVLKNNFYEGLPSSYISKIKKQGAISGCTLMAI